MRQVSGFKKSLTQLERTVQAESFFTDFCITERMSDMPERYLHVVAHPAP